VGYNDLRSRAGPLLGAALSLSCASATTPQPNAVATAVVIATDTNDLSVVNPRSGEITELGPLPPFKYAGAMSPDSATFYVLAELSFPTREIVAIDTRSLRIEWRVPVATLEQESATGLSIDGAMTVSPDGNRLLVQASSSSGDGIAVVDLHLRVVTNFIPLASVVDMAPVAANSTMPNGAVLVAGVHQRGPGRYDGLLFVLDGTTLTVQDSATVSSSTDDRAAGLQQVLASPDGEHAYVVGFQQVRYDLRERQITDSVPTPSLGRLTISPDGNTIYRTDAGDGRDFPGSGNIFVYGADLTPRESIDVTALAPAPNALQVATDDAVPSSDGRLLYVAAGSPRATSYGGEPARLLVLDPTARVLVKAVPLKGWSPDVLFAR